MCEALGGASPPDYAAIKMPTLMVAGEEDKSAPLAGCEEIFERTGGEKSMEVVQAMGHWFCIEDPDSIVKLIGAFVEKVTQPNWARSSYIGQDWTGLQECFIVSIPG